MLHKCLTLLIAVGLWSSVKCVPETTHLIQVDHQGRTVHLDVIFDEEEKTVLAVVGDVSKYEHGIQTVNFHDYNTGYGVLKNVNKRSCIMARALVPMSPDVYKAGFTTEVHEHYLHITPEKLNYSDIEDIAGKKIASFCKDYDTYFAVATPMAQHKRDLPQQHQQPESKEQLGTNWCVASSCFAPLDVLLGK